MRFALVKHDVAIALAVLLGLSKRAADCLTLLVIVPLLTLVARARLSGLPDGIRELVTFGATSLIITLLAKALIERLWFHRMDGALARDAQRSRAWIEYFVPLVLSGTFIGLAALAVLGLVEPRGMLLGVCIGMPTGLLLPFVRERIRRWWRRFAPRKLRSFSQTRHALGRAVALSAGLGSLNLFIPSENYLNAIVIGAYGLVVILLTAAVDSGVVRYMTLVGNSAASLLRRWLPIQIALLWPIALVSLAAREWVPATVAALIALALPLVTTLRIVTYRSFSRLIADWTVATVILAAAYGAFTVPPLGSAIIVAAIVWLTWRGEGARWLLA